MPSLRRALPILATLGAIGALPLADATASPTLNTYPTGNNTKPTGLTLGPDGAVWLTEQGPPPRIGRVTLGGTASSFSTTLPDDSRPTGIAAGADGALWFAAPGGPGRLAHMTTAGALTTLVGGVAGVLSANTRPTDAAAGPDGLVWFTEQSSGRIGKATTGGVVTEYTTGLPTSARPASITLGPDGALWFVQNVSGGDLGRITTTGAVSYIDLGPDATPTNVTPGPDGALWFSATIAGARDVIGRATPSGSVRRFTLPDDGVPGDLVAAGDDALYFTNAVDDDVHQIVRLTTDGVFSHTTLPDGTSAVSVLRGPGGNVWFTQLDPDAVSRLTVPPGLDAPARWTPTARSATTRVGVRPNAQDTTWVVRYGTTTAYGQSSPTLTTLSSSSTGPTDVVLTGLVPDTLYHARVEATNATGTTIGPDVVFTTAIEPAVIAPAPGTGTTDPSPAPGTGSSEPSSDPSPVSAPSHGDDPAADGEPRPEPVRGKTAVVQVGSGTVRVRAPGADSFSELDGASPLPVGALVDTRKGTVELTTVRDASGAVQTGSFWGGVFEIRQSAASAGMTELALHGGSFGACPRRSVRPAHGTRSGTRTASAARRRSHKAVRSLWGSDHGGRFRTRGHDSVATVRGTRWRTVDFCDGTLVQVASGKVLVTARGAKHGRLVSAGHSRFVAHGR